MTWRAGTVLRRTVGGVAYALGRVVVGGQGIADRTVNGNGHKQEKLHHPPVPLCRLVLTHAAGFCKELWSPVISEIETAITSPRLSVDQQQKPFTDTLAVDSVTSVLCRNCRVGCSRLYWPRGLQSPTSRTGTLGRLSRARGDRGHAGCRMVTFMC